MQQSKPQLSTYIQFFDLLSSLQSENLITPKEKQQLKVGLALKDANLLNIITMHMDEDPEEFKFGILNFLKQSKSTEEKVLRTTRRSRSTVNDIVPIKGMQQPQEASEINEEAVQQQIDYLSHLVVTIQQLDKQGKNVSKKLNDNLHNLGRLLTSLDGGHRNTWSEQQIQAKQMVNNLTLVYKKIKRNFDKYMHSHLLIMDEIISYEQLFTLLKQLTYLLVGCDSFSFLVLKNAELDIFSSDTDTFIKLDLDVVFVQLLQLSDELNAIATGKLQLLSSPRLSSILNCEDSRTYIHQVGSEPMYFLYHQSPKMQQQINYNFLQLTNEYSFFDEVNELSKFLFETIKRAKVHFFSPLEIADTVQDIGLAFVRCSKYLLIEKLLEEVRTKHYMVERIIRTPESALLRSPNMNVSKEAVSLEFKDTQNIVVNFINLHLGQRIDRDLLLTVFHQPISRQIQQCYEKYLRFIKQCYEKRAFYKFFLRSNDSLIFEFDKRGHLIFLSRPIPKNISDDFKITFNLSMIQQNSLRYSRIFESNVQLISQIENYLQEASIWNARNMNDFMDSYYEIFIKTEEKSFKGFVVVFQQRQDAWIRNQQKSLSPTNGKLDKEIARRIKKSLLQQETLNYVNKLSESQDMSNSIALLYMPKKKSPSNRLLQSAHQGFINSPRVINSRTGMQSIKTVENHETTPDHKSIFSKYQYKLEANKFEEKPNDSILDTVAFNILDVKSKVEKHRIVWALLRRKNFIEEYNIPMEALGDFLIALEVKYNSTNNPFHNYDHGISVMQFTYYLLTLLDRTQHQIDYFAQFVLVISALCHDVAHTGRTNLFEINSLSALAIRYHDKSVLEQHHAATAIQLLREEKTNILIALEDDQFKSFRKQLVSNILHTDMSDHFRLVKDFETTLKEKQAIGGESESDQRLFTGMLIHSADFNGTVRKYPNSRRWSELVNQEFIKQFEEEGKLGYPQQPYMKDLHKLQSHVMAKSEIGFCKVIVRPLYALLSWALEGGLQDCIDNIDETILEWDKLCIKD